MYTRNIALPSNHSFFLFGPRGTGKSTLIKDRYPDSIYIDLLDFATYNRLLANPHLLETFIPKNFDKYIIIDEVQRIPELLNEVHRLIESQYKYKFILTGSSARKLKSQGVNLLAGRAYTYHLYPLTAIELGADFDLAKALKVGLLPSNYDPNTDPERYLNSYITTYLKEEILQEGLTRNITAFAKFLEVASFSVGSPLNMTAIARDVGIERKVIENYFTILEDLMIGIRLPVFSKGAKRKLINHPKFYYFDTGIFQTARPKGPLDSSQEIGGLALESLIFQNLNAINQNLDLKYQLYYHRTIAGAEVDFVAYGESGLIAIEVKHSRTWSAKDVSHLLAFKSEYPEAKLYLIYTGDQTNYYSNITILPATTALTTLPHILSG